ncbi:MAG: DUF2062 domain-containing protein, partial [Alphaproteobacteria bacterium]|nr:DUF2062 domain-containing protein [Alphaproteobacteria bacterium]
FDRRHKPSLGDKTRNLLWPRSGWGRATRYIAHRVRRIPGSPYAIAAGFACGAAVSMTPFPGFHFLLSGLLAWAIGGSVLASAIGTAVGNPWTFPFIWLWIYKCGSWILGSSSELAGEAITLSFLLDHPMDVFLPMLMGSLPTAAIAWMVFFWPIRRMVASYQSHRQNRLAQRALAGQSAGGGR